MLYITPKYINERLTNGKINEYAISAWGKDKGHRMI